MRIRSYTLILIMVVSLFIADFCFAASSFIENINKIRKSEGYEFKINYQTTQKWTDGLVFKLFCTFSKGTELSFESSSHNNIREGWHKTEVEIPMVYRERYGYIKDYRVELYHDGILVSIKSM